MRAAPDKNILIVGNGRLAQHLKHFFHLKNIQFQQWTRSSGLDFHANHAEIILLAISDDSILNFFENHRTQLENKMVIHFSGSFYHQEIFGIHPLMSFSGSFFADHIYDQIPLIIDHQMNLLSSFFVNPIIKINPELKAKYHALCVLAVSAPHLIWKQMQDELVQLGIDKTETDLYLKNISDNYLKLSNSLTGPLVRGDVKTIKNNLNALDNTHLKNIYENLCHLKGIQL